MEPRDQMKMKPWMLCVFGTGLAFLAPGAVDATAASGAYSVQGTHKSDISVFKMAHRLHESTWPVGMGGRDWHPMLEPITAQRRAELVAIFRRELASLDKRVKSIKKNPEWVFQPFVYVVEDINAIVNGFHELGAHFDDIAHRRTYLESLRTIHDAKRLDIGLRRVLKEKSEDPVEQEVINAYQNMRTALRTVSLSHLDKLFHAKTQATLDTIRANIGILDQPEMRGRLELNNIFVLSTAMKDILQKDELLSGDIADHLVHRVASSNGISELRKLHKIRGTVTGKLPPKRGEEHKPLSEKLRDLGKELATHEHMQRLSAWYDLQTSEVIPHVDYEPIRTVFTGNFSQVLGAALQEGAY